MIDVIALKVGFFGGRLIKIGTSFEIKSKDDLGSWMKEVKKTRKKRTIKVEDVAETRSEETKGEGAE